MKQLIEKAKDWLKNNGYSRYMHVLPSIMAEFADEYHKTQMEKLNGEIRESEKEFCECPTLRVIRTRNGRTCCAICNGLIQ